MPSKQLDISEVYLNSGSNSAEKQSGEAKDQGFIVSVHTKRYQEVFDTFDPAVSRYHAPFDGASSCGDATVPSFFVGLCMGWACDEWT